MHRLASRGGRRRTALRAQAHIEPDTVLGGGGEAMGELQRPRMALPGQVKGKPLVYPAGRGKGEGAQRPACHKASLPRPSNRSADAAVKRAVRPRPRRPDPMGIALIAIACVFAACLIAEAFARWRR